MTSHFSQGKKESGYEHCQMVNGQFVLNHEGTGGIQELETHPCICKDAQRQLSASQAGCSNLTRNHTWSLEMYWHLAAPCQEAA